MCLGHHYSTLSLFLCTCTLRNPRQRPISRNIIPETPNTCTDRHTIYRHIRESETSKSDNLTNKKTKTTQRVAPWCCRQMNIGGLTIRPHTTCVYCGYVLHCTCSWVEMNFGVRNERGNSQYGWFFFVLNITHEKESV